MNDSSGPKKAGPLNPSIPKHAHNYLRQLTKTGVHGKTVAAVARTLIYDQLKWLLSQGVIRWVYAENDEEAEDATVDDD